LISIPRRTPAYLTAQDAETLISAITKPWLREFVIVALNTGMRRGELLSLRWIDVDVVARMARITNRVDFTTKSGEERNISLNESAINAIQRCKVSTRHEYIFSDEHGVRLTADRVTHAVKKSIRAANLPEGLHLHSFRHSFASALCGLGTSLKLVGSILGHSNTKTTEIYSHLLPHQRQTEVEKITIGLNSIIPLKP
jgi:integrase